MAVTSTGTGTGNRTVSLRGNVCCSDPRVGCWWVGLILGVGYHWQALEASSRSEAAIMMRLSVVLLGWMRYLCIELMVVAGAAVHPSPHSHSSPDDVGADSNTLLYVSRHPPQAARPSISEPRIARPPTVATDPTVEALAAGGWALSTASANNSATDTTVRASATVCGFPLTRTSCDDHRLCDTSATAAASVVAIFCRHVPIIICSCCIEPRSDAEVNDAPAAGALREVGAAIATDVMVVVIGDFDFTQAAASEM